MTTDLQNKLDTPDNDPSSLGWRIGCSCLGMITAVLLALAIWIVGGTAMVAVLFLAPLEFSGFLEENGDPFTITMSIVTIILVLLGGGLGYLGGKGVASILRRN